MHYDRFMKKTHASPTRHVARNDENFRNGDAHKRFDITDQQGYLYTTTASYLVGGRVIHDVATGDDGHFGFSLRVGQ